MPLDSTSKEGRVKQNIAERAAGQKERRRQSGSGARHILFHFP